MNALQAAAGAALILLIGCREIKTEPVEDIQDQAQRYAMEGYEAGYEATPEATGAAAAR